MTHRNIILDKIHILGLFYVLFFKRHERRDNLEELLVSIIKCSVNELTGMT